MVSHNPSQEISGEKHRVCEAHSMSDFDWTSEIAVSVCGIRNQQDLNEMSIPNIFGRSGGLRAMLTK